MTGKIITITQQKGGSGKTTLAAHIAVACAQNRKLKTAILDTDPQGSLGRWFMARKENANGSGPDMTFRTASAWGARYEAQALAEEHDIVVATTGALEPSVGKVLGPEQIIKLQQLVRRVPVAPEVIKYAVKLTRASRPKEPDAPDFVKEYVSWGAGPRASQFLILGGKARAVLNGRFAVNAEDVRQLARPVLRHRIITNFHAEVSSIKSPDIVDRLLEHVKP